MKNRWFIAAAALVLVVAGFAGLPAYAQQTGSIEGAVVDSNNAPLPGVSIEIKSASMQGTRTSVTDANGRFKFPVLPPGAYTVTSALSGFTKAERTNVRVSLGGTAIVNVTLAVSVSQEIVVTGEAPVVDTATTTGGTNYRSDVISKLPLTRNYADVVRLQPGVQTDSGETQGRSLALSIYGSTSAENLFLIDGVNTTNVIKGFQGKSINSEFVEEVEVKTGGYQAEFGRNTGGVVNVITKQGGNEFHGSAFGYFDNASTRANPKVEETADYSQSGDIQASYQYPTNTRWELGASLGGYFMKDRIWFFGAYDKVKVDQKEVPLAGVRAGEQFPYTQDANLYSGKLTFRITDSTELNASIFADPSKNDGTIGVPQSLNPDSFTGSQDLGGQDFAIRLNQLTGNWGLLNLQYSRHADKYKLNSSQAQQVLDYADLVLNGGALLYAGGWGQVFGPTVNNESKRDSFKGAMSFFLGSHEVKVGGDYQKDVTSGSTYMSGGSRLRIYPCIAGRANYNCDLTKAPFADTSAGRIQVFYRHDFFTASGTDLNPINSVFEVPSKLFSIFAQDEWKVMPNLTVNFGVRYDDQKVYKGDNSLAFDLDNQWSPRVGFSWDFLNNGTSKLYGSYGRFHYATPTDLNVRVFTANTSVNSYNYSPTVLATDPTAPRRQSIQVGSVAGEPVDAGMKASYSDEITFGVEKAISSTFSVGAKYTYRTLGRTIEDRCDLDASDPGNGFNSCAIFNPGGSGPAASGVFPSCNGTGNPTDPTAGECGAGVAVGDAKRIFRGVEVVAKKRVGDSLWLQASYLYSMLKGNYSGAISTASGQTDPGINADFDYYQFNNNAYGLLELDRPHQFRADGAYSTPFGLTAGLGFKIRSGVPVSRNGWFNGFYTTELYLDERGSNGRTPTEFDADLSLAYNIKVGPVTITPQLYLFNVFNRQTVAGYDTRFNPNGSFVTNPDSPFYGKAGVEPGTEPYCPATATAPCSDNADYGKINDRMGARSLHAAVKISF